MIEHPNLLYSRIFDQLRPLQPDQRQAEFRRLARKDLYFLLRYVLGRQDMAKTWLWERCREVQAEPNGCLDLWAREHYKSTIITYGLTIQDILTSHGDDPDPKWQGKEPTFGIFSHTRPIAKGFLRQIKTEAETNVFLKALFPDIFWDNPKKEAPKWSEDDGIVVQRRGNPKESTVEAWGLVDGQPTSKHFDRLIYDDVVTLESITPDMVKKTTERWEVSINLGTEDGAARYIGTRYHDDDTYRVILDRGVAKPRIYPATDDGTASGVPVLISQQTLDDKRRAMGSYNFACQMLLDPIPPDTAYFRAEWFNWYDELPDHCTFWGASDYAVSEGDGDYTVHGVIAVDPDENIYIVDWWRAQTASDVWVETCINMALAWKPLMWAEENGQIVKGVGPFLKTRMRERKAYFRREQYTPSADKATRAQSFRGRAAMGMIYIRRGAPWASDLVAELARFPFGKNDDQVDVLSLFGLALDDMYPKLVKPRPKPYEGTGQQILDTMKKLRNQKAGRYG
jgi:predicted phage terminase large subunit-like protein